MTKDSIIFNREAAERTIHRFTTRKLSTREWRLIDLRSLFYSLRAAGAITVPLYVSVEVEEHRVGRSDRLRVVLADHRRSTCGVTSDHARDSFATEVLSRDDVFVTIGQFVDIAQELLGAAHALKLGEDRVKGEVDYSDPERLIGLLVNRDCEILDRAAVEAAVAADPGPFLYSDIDLCEDGGTWENSGARWANRLERRLAEQGAIKCP
jgi:hypothetical protein